MPRHCGGSALYDGIWGLAAPTPWMINGDSHMEGIVRHYGTGAIAYEYGTSTLGACARDCSDLKILSFFWGNYFFGAGLSSPCHYSRLILEIFSFFILK